MPGELWLDTLEEIVSGVKFDDEGEGIPILQVSANNGFLPPPHKGHGRKKFRRLTLKNANLVFKSS